MAESNYIGVNGIITQSLDEIITDLTAKFQSVYGTNINLDSNSPDGQWLNILAQEKKDTLDLFVQFYNNLDTERVVGIPQQILYKLNNCTIKAYTYSYVYINVTTTTNVNLIGLDEDIENADGTGYTVSDSNGNRWILAQSQTLEAGTHLLNFRAADLGSVTALPNTITVMETILAGVSGVTNPANNYITGATGESTAAYRLRRNKTVSMPSQGFIDSVESQILSLDNVTQCVAYQNRSDNAFNNIPAHSVWIIVEGGNPTDIGRIIYNNIPPGIPMKGDIEVQVLRPNGSYETLNYDVPTAVPLYIKMNIQLLSGAIDQDYLKQQLSAITFNIHQSAEGVNIAAITKDSITTNGSPYDVLVSKDGVTYSEVVTPNELDEYFTISAENILITVVS